MNEVDAGRDHATQAPVRHNDDIMTRASHPYLSMLWAPLARAARQAHLL